jgi:TorA maturation chaperone TorD
MNVTSEHLQLLSLLLGTPVRGSLEMLETLAGEHPWLEVPLEELREMPLAQWQGEHTRLFVSGYPKTAAPPFISALRHGLMGGGAEEELRGFYRHLGMEPSGMPADYLGTLFECAAWLLSQNGRQPELDELWQNYLLPILPEFSQRLFEQGCLRLYREMGNEISRISQLPGSGMRATA